MELIDTIKCKTLYVKEAETYRSVSWKMHFTLKHQLNKKMLKKNLICPLSKSLIGWCKDWDIHPNNYTYNWQVRLTPKGETEMEAKSKSLRLKNLNEIMAENLILLLLSEKSLPLN